MAFARTGDAFAMSLSEKSSLAPLRYSASRKLGSVSGDSVIRIAEVAGDSSDGRSPNTCPVQTPKVSATRAVDRIANDMIGFMVGSLVVVGCTMVVRDLSLAFING